MYTFQLFHLLMSVLLVPDFFNNLFVRNILFFFFGICCAAEVSMGIFFYITPGTYIQAFFQDIKYR